MTFMHDMVMFLVVLCFSESLLVLETLVDAGSSLTGTVRPPYKQPRPLISPLSLSVSLGTAVLLQGEENSRK